MGISGPVGLTLTRLATDAGILLQTLVGNLMTSHGNAAVADGRVLRAKNNTLLPLPSIVALDNSVQCVIRTEPVTASRPGCPIRPSRVSHAADQRQY